VFKNQKNNQKSSQKLITIRKITIKKEIIKTIKKEAKMAVYLTE